MTTEEMAKAIGTKLGELAMHAKSQGRQDVWDAIITPWAELQQVRVETTRACDAGCQSECAAVMSSLQSASPQAIAEGGEAPQSSSPRASRGSGASSSTSQPAQEKQAGITKQQNMLFIRVLKC